MVEFRLKTNIKLRPHPMGLFVTHLPPGLLLLVIIGFAVLITMLVTGHESKVEKQVEVLENQALGDNVTHGIKNPP
jgi:hypothetical protein